MKNLNHKTNERYWHKSRTKTTACNNDTVAMKNPENGLEILLAADGAASQKGRSFNKTCQWKKLSFIFLIFIFGVNMNACSMFGSSMSWKEEVLLHDGTKMIVSRSQTRSGAGEIGQGPPITEHSITFTPVGSSQPITWKTESTIEGGHTDMDLLALGIVHGTPYIATIPLGCLVYEKWGRPNPPYIFFKYISQQWRQIPLQEFPAEIKQPNLVINIYRMEDIKSEEKKSGFVSAVGVKEINGSLRQEEYQTILRQPMVRTGKSASVVDCHSFSSSLKAPYPIPPRDSAEPKKQPPQTK